MVDWTKPIICRNGDQAVFIGTRPDGVPIVALRENDGSWEHFTYGPDGNFARRPGDSTLDVVNTEPPVPVKEFTHARLRNALAILRSIDAYELGDPNIPGEYGWYAEFRDDPYLYFMRCPDAHADLIWAALSKRMK